MQEPQIQVEYIPTVEFLNHWFYILSYRKIWYKMTHWSVLM
jgi:hypothetical protein